MVIGMALIAQAVAPLLEKLILSIIIFLRPSDKKLKIIVSNNMKSHSVRNLKTSMMFTLTVTFMIFVSSSFASVEYIVMALTNSIIGADLALFTPGGLGPLALNEKKISAYLESNLVSNGGIVTNYGFLP